MAAAAAVVLMVASASAQPPPRRPTTIAALRQFPGFFHLQNVVLRGEFAEQNGRILLESEDGNIRAIPEEGVRLPSGVVEVRAHVIDVGRLEPGDPRVPETDGRDSSRWPRPGEELFVRVSGAAAVADPASPSVRVLAMEPWRYTGQAVTVTGNFRGRNLFGDLPGAPGRDRYDFVIRGAEGAVWVSGMRPRGRDFDLDIDRRVDSAQWLEVTGTVAYEQGLVRIDATALAAVKPPSTIRAAEEPGGPPPALPPVEVVFSSPTPEEADVSADTPVRIQFSRGIDSKTIAGAIRVVYAGTDETAPAFETAYDAATRAVTVRFAAPLQAGRQVQVEVGEQLKAFDGGAAQPWTLTFMVQP